ncbi:hypothetical protein PF005_g21518 [Phytophthora fragariae]|uniref:WRKY19-like zinc finger domain-containing protein n=1 Tax=Phytophthora fragariae TaxID=53985 RepID=A0A6A3DZ54_9STRA|nr:hypothetical protein PF009_g22843 [Phytophthora fragariae]KAE9083361.1 hypothetical protein PF010_g21242 [Phytophthora fragariae]KAE9108052.1 hypothetical protein PF006_g20961 [Phytophthora fragariae]KAE9184825.1 hypothetical protein PF005_g21518 [Phytophthora fragariae]KAE9196753.1 hypothetical protein PF002_g22963 [Phytophthora fragariae]
MEEQTVNCFPDTAAAHALETPAIRHSAQQLATRMAKNQPSVRSISAGNAPQPRVDNIGDCGIATSSPSGDCEFFLDEFIAENDNKKFQSSGKVATAQDNGGQGKSSRQNSSHFETVRIVPDNSTTKAWASDGLVKLSATGGGEGSLSVKVSMSKKRPLPVVPVKIHEKEEEEEEAPEQWTRGEFMTSTRSASQQAAIELGVQMAWGLKFAAGRVHSMIRCSEQKEATYSELANEFLGVIAAEGREEKDQSAQLVTETGRPCCSHPGCTKQAQAKGKCIAHGGSTVEVGTRRIARSRDVQSGIKLEVCALLTEVALCAKRKAAAKKLSLKVCAESMEVAPYARLKAVRRSVAFVGTVIGMVLSTVWSSAKERARWKSAQSSG